MLSRIEFAHVPIDIKVFNVKEVFEVAHQKPLVFRVPVEEASVITSPSPECVCIPAEVKLVLLGLYAVSRSDDEQDQAC